MISSASRNGLIIGKYRTENIGQQIQDSLANIGQLNQKKYKYNGRKDGEICWKERKDGLEEKMDWKERQDGLERKKRWIRKKKTMGWKERMDWKERKEGLERKV